jgi:hypothetical protein
MNSIPLLRTLFPLVFAASSPLSSSASVCTPILNGEEQSREKKNVEMKIGQILVFFVMRTADGPVAVEVVGGPEDCAAELAHVDPRGRGARVRGALKQE